MVPALRPAGEPETLARRTLTEVSRPISPRSGWWRCHRRARAGRPLRAPHRHAGLLPARAAAAGGDRGGASWKRSREPARCRCAAGRRREPLPTPLGAAAGVRSYLALGIDAPGRAPLRSHRGAPRGFTTVASSPQRLAEAAAPLLRVGFARERRPPSAALADAADYRHELAQLSSHCVLSSVRSCRLACWSMSNQDPSKARDTALQGALTQIERQFGKGSVMRMGDPGAQVKVEAIPTGALSLDLALGIGGIPRGRIVEVFGPESSGKTTLIYHVIAEAQKLGGVCAFIDAEHAMDPLYAQRIGVNIDELLVSQPDYGEQALEIADMLVRSGAVDVVAVDSVAALTPRSELEGQMGDQSVGLQARMMSQAMRKLAGNLNRTKTLCMFTNQIREKVGVMFGSPETQPGGRALKFYASQRLDIRRIETLKDGTEAVGNRVRVKVVKNKVAAPFRQAEFDIEFGQGISTSGCILDLGIEHSIVTKSGSFFSYGDERLGQGRNNAKVYLDDHPEVAKEIEGKIYDVLGVSQDLVEPIDGDPAAAAALVGAA